MKRLRILLVNVGLRTFSNFWAIPPMGILALAAYVREKFPVDIRLVNQRLDNCSAEELGRQAQEFAADVVGLSAMTTTACLLPDIIAATRRAAPKACIIAGGPYVSAAGTQALEKYDADIAIAGEGELAFEQVIGALIDGGGFDGIPGLIWRNPDGAVIQNPGTTGFVEDLDSLPMPAYDLIDLPAYWRRRTTVPLLWRRYATLITSRGCPFRCIWCHNIFGKRIRMHSPERILDEMLYLHKKYGVDDFDIQDDTFNFDRERVLRLCGLLLGKGLKFKLAVPNGVRGDILTRDVIDALADAGLYMCMFALETGSPRIQKLTEKNLNIPRFLENCAIAAQRRVFIQSCCMLGFPTETEAELQQTIDVACGADFHTASFFNVTPYPGTPLYDLVQETCPQKLAHINYDLRNSSTMRVNLTDLPDDVFYAYQRKAVRKFYSSPRRLMRIVRDHPQRWALPAYVPLICYRGLKGLIGPEDQPNPV